MDEYTAFVDDYRGAWEKAVGANDIAPLTRFFHVPYLAVGADGAATLVKSTTEVDDFNRVRLALFLKDQATRWRFRGCDAMTLGAQGAFVTVNWEGHRADGSVARAWRHYYNLMRGPSGLKILVSTFSAGSHG